MEQTEREAMNIAAPAKRRRRMTREPVDGFEYGGKRWGSLSAIARAITGSRWNGPLFFGLGPRKK